MKVSDQLNVSDQSADVSGSLTPNREPIAIIGIGCRFAGVNGPDAFWQLLKEGTDAISDVPPHRFDIEEVYDPVPGAPGKIISRMGGFIRDADSFDAAFFGISPREALRMDPQQRILLEVAWEALEDAGLTPDRTAGSATGVFIGACTSDYEDIQYYLRDRSEIDLYVSTGTARAVMSGRISYAFDLRGPSLTVDTACSSSLVGIHLACQSIWTGECCMAVAGGVNLVLLPEMSMGFSRAKMLASDSRCKFGDQSADGFIRSDGAGVVILKPLAQALADGDPIYAVIRGTAVNNDGRTSGLLATPSRVGQEAVLRQAYHNADISRDSIQYVEAHGTGTVVGDPVELQSIGAVLAKGRDENNSCLVGSVKTNIGHTEGAAGIAGLIKVALSLKHGAIPPSLHFNRPNPNVPWQEIQVRVPQTLTPWPESAGPRRAGVSSSGISATNVHVVLEEVSGENIPALYGSPALYDSSAAELLTISAHTPEALLERAQSYLPLREGRYCFRDICYTANARRAHHDHRLALVAQTAQGMADLIEAFLRAEARPGLFTGRAISGRERKLVFVFPGQGSQWVGMGRGLLAREPVFRAAIERCDSAIFKHTGWSLLVELEADQPDSNLDRIDVVQPCIFSIQVALAELWRSWGIEPDAVVGQSMGEIAAGYVAGALSLEDAAQVICRRSLLLRRVTGRGGMLVVGLSFEKSRELLAGYEDRVSIAVSSSPTATVLSGETLALEEIRASLEKRGIFNQAVKVDVASHSPQMDPLRQDLLAELSSIKPRPASIPLYSTVTASADPDLALDGDYWARNLREPVLFLPAVEKLVAGGHHIFLEIGPHPVLVSPIQQALNHFGHDGMALPSMRAQEDERSVMMGSLGALYTLGYPIDWSKLYAGQGRTVRLPAYPWQREKFWLGVDSESVGRLNHVAGKRPSLLSSSTHFKSAAHPGTYFWQIEMSTDIFPYLSEHRVQSVAVLPAAAYIEMALSAAREDLDDTVCALEDLQFKKALYLPEGKAQKLQLVLSSEFPGKASFQFFATESEDAQATWTLHAEGAIRFHRAAPLALTQTAEPQSLESVLARCLTRASQGEIYSMLAGRGLEYGAAFQGVAEIRRRRGEAIGRIIIPESLKHSAATSAIHPVLLDSCLQVLAATLPVETGNPATYLPVGIEELVIHADPAAGTWSHALLRPADSSSCEALKGDVVFLDERGEPVLEVRGISMQRIERRDATPRLERLFYEMTWQRRDRPRTEQGLSALHPDQRGIWIIFSDGYGIGDEIIERLESRGETCIRVMPGETYSKISSVSYQIEPSSTDDYRRLFESTFTSSRLPCLGIVHLWSFESAGADSLEAIEAAQSTGCKSALFLVQAIAVCCNTTSPRLWLVTGGTQPVGECVRGIAIEQAPLWGLGRAIAQEHPELRCTLVDMSPDLSAEESAEETGSLCLELLAGDDDNQIALRGGARYVARLINSACDGENTSLSNHGVVALVEGESFRAEILTPGMLDSLSLIAAERQDPGPGEVEIQVCAVGLNFRDVLLALGLLPQASGLAEDLGWDCAGRIARLGQGVEGFKVGDEVFAVATPCLSAYAVTPASVVMPKPSGMSFAEAATLPIAFLTAYYGLCELARLRKGDRILIHAATGGVGLAAVQIARKLGAEVFATAGSPEKRDYLRLLGIEHVFDSRSLDFTEEVMRASGGEGVDVVLNSLSGEAIEAGLLTLRSGGRFLELGRTDIYQNSRLGLRPFRNNLSFLAIDVALLIKEQPFYMGEALRRAIDLFCPKGERPLPFQVFPVSEIKAAFRLMMQAKHIGKIVLSIEGQQVEVAARMKDARLKDAIDMRRDSTYLITGGMGGLGLCIARWMAARKAGHIVLAGRNEPSRHAREIIEGLNNASDVEIRSVDVGDREQMAGLIQQINRSERPLRGIIHAAGVLDDGILLRLGDGQFKNVCAPKISGAWNLHELTLDAPLDFFVLFSSAASLLGSAGQGNYSAANAFLDALAYYRRAQGLPALSINWGPWAEIGLAAMPGREGRLAQRGIESISPDEGIEALEYLLCRDRAQVGVMSFDFGLWKKFYPACQQAGLFEELSAQAQIPATIREEQQSSRARILAAQGVERERVAGEYLGHQLARVLGLSHSGLTKLDPDQPINRLGIDSLMAVELKTRIQTDLGVSVSIMQLLRGASLAQLTAQTLESIEAEPTPAGDSLLSDDKGWSENLATAVTHWEEITL